MPIDRQARRLLSMLTAAGAAGGDYETPEERRTSLENLIALAGGEGPAMDAVEDHIANAVPLRLYRPTKLADAALLFLHGGGWVAGDLDTHDGLCRRIAKASGCVVIAVDYRLAPEHPFPAALEDGLTALRWCHAEAARLHVDPARLGIVGDSAGGALAASICRLARDENGPPIALQLLLCPILDLVGRSASRLRLAIGHFVDEATLARDAELYLGESGDPDDPRISPLRATDLSGMPATLIQAAEFDPFVDEARAYAQKLETASVPVRFVEHPGMIHFFYALPAVITYAENAVSKFAREAGVVLKGA